MKRRRARGRALTLAFVGTIFALALVLFPLRGRGAEPRRSEQAPAEATDAPRSATGASSPGAGSPAASPGAASSGSKRENEDLLSVPIGRGLPVKVNVAVFFGGLKSFDDTKGEFEATTDLRLRWTDPRLRYPASESYRGYKEWRGKEAEAELTKIWTPTIDVDNRVETFGYVGRRLRVYPDGLVETLTRTAARHTVHVSADTFPFDRQGLAVDLIVRDDTTDEVVLRFDSDDVAFSRVPKRVRLDGWTTGIVELRSDAIAGWNGDRYSRMTASLAVDRDPTGSLAPIFIPLIASLLIPLLAVWMNRANEEGEFEVDAFELANMCIGGLFSVIALSFAIYSSYTVIASGDNTVTRLFGLNYAMLAITLAIVVLCFRYHLPAKLFGPYVQREVFTFISWALPILSLATSAAFLFVAAA